ncbi:copper chaperone [Laceyella sediminis]|jgi:copper chaperone|uniref:Copper chaperone n=1 Tax=Laceyella sediminis TaxID=573074 RepID=A0ABX5EMY2_9BACL|nr:copper ion binding protein [Laceyella sediminis]PRZ13813.1 copper chaperone [Laceyella sediminis]
MKKVELRVEGMSCGHCVNAIEGALKKLHAHAVVDLASKTVTVEFDENDLSVDRIKEAIEEQGYDVM